jgi:hypothetical protein
MGKRALKHLFTGSHVHLRIGDIGFQHIENSGIEAHICCQMKDKPMTRLSISIAAVLLTMTLVPSANAYGTDPAPQTLSTLSDVRFVVQDTAIADGTCTLQITPAVASILGMADDWRTGGDVTGTAVACVGN